MVFEKIEEDIVNREGQKDRGVDDCSQHKITDQTIRGQVEFVEHINRTGEIWSLTLCLPKPRHESSETGPGGSKPRGEFLDGGNYLLFGR